MQYKNFLLKNCVDQRNVYFTFNDDKIIECPLCKKIITPKPLNGCVYKKNERILATILYLCNGCSSTFMGVFEASNSSSDINTINYVSSTFIECTPIKYVPKNFEQNIAELSPQFVKIYNQSLAAESAGLDEIAGLGYRKALEFLIKDFAIHQHPADAEEIKRMLLSPCINNYIDAPNIKTLATRSAWIGNDEAHYIRRQEDRDVSDMKRFISAAVYFISMVLITEEAETMEPQ